MSTKPITCTGAAFTGLKNPYTGEPIVVKMVIRENAEPLFFAPDTYDTAKRQPSSKTAYENWNCVDGVFGLRGTGRPVCAYTGKPLQFKSDEDSCWFVGGFNPTHMHTRDEFLKFVTMRGGKPTREVAPLSQRVTPAKADPAPMPKSHEVQITDTAMSEVGKLVKKAREGGR